MEGEDRRVDVESEDVKSESENAPKTLKSDSAGKHDVSWRRRDSMKRLRAAEACRASLSASRRDWSEQIRFCALACEQESRCKCISDVGF